MARPIKKGLDYYSIDVDIFQDRKIRRLLKKYNGFGFTVYVYLLTEIYRNEGYYINWDSDFAFDISSDLGMTEVEINGIVNCCCEVGLFNKELFDNNKVLTSKGIQLRWQEISKKAKRAINQITEFSLIEEISIINSEETGVNSEITSINTEFSTQRKGKERKEKESEVNEIISPSPDDLISIETVFQIISKDKDWIKTVGINNQLKNEPAVLNHLRNFRTKLENEGVTEKSISDAKKHFSNWLKIELKILRA